MQNPKRALIVGCGYVGLALADALQKADWIVTGIKRSGSLPQCLIHLTIDVRMPFDLGDRYDVVFYLVSAGGYTQQNYEDAYVQGVSNTLRALKKSGSRPRFIYVSSTSLFAQDHGEWVDEDSEICEEGFARAALSSGENLVRTSDIPFSIVRFAGIYGPSRDHLVRQIKSGQPILKLHSHFTNRIHQNDCSGMLLHIATIDHSKDLYIGVDNEPSDYNEVIEWVGKLVSCDISQDRISAPPLSHHSSHKRCSNARIRASGYQFIFPTYREGFGALALESV